MLGDDVLAVIPEFRSAAQSLMVDTGRITRGAAVVFDPDTGTHTPGAGTIIHEGPCRVRVQMRSDGETDIFGDEQLTTTRFVVTFPHTLPNVFIDDVVTIIESDDPHIALRSFRVIAVPSLTFLLYRELGVEAVE